MNADQETLNAVSHRIIGCAYLVAEKLGMGFLEKCYENALAHELRKAGLTVMQQVPLKVWYDDIVIGEYVADLIVEDSVIVEVKAISGLDTIHSAQCINYLAATKFPICLLINFCKKVEVKRLVGPAFNAVPSSS